MNIYRVTYKDTPSDNAIIFIFSHNEKSYWVWLYDDGTCDSTAVRDYKLNEGYNARADEFIKIIYEDC